jgi:hypothetical protein
MGDIAGQTELFKVASAFGVGTFIAVLVLFWNRADNKSHRKEMKAYIAAQIVREKALIETVQANTSAFSSLEKALNNLSSGLELEGRVTNLETAINGALNGGRSPHLAREGETPQPRKPSRKRNTRPSLAA